MKIMKMNFREASKEWVSGLPIGNGRLAAMVSAKDIKDVITVNHEWLWRGDTNLNREAFHAAKYLPIVRELIDNNEHFRATQAADLFFGGFGTGSGIENNLDFYQFAGDLVFEIDDVTEFCERTLDISSGIAESTRKTKATKVYSEAFCDSVNNIILAKWSAEDGKVFSGSLLFLKELSENETKTVTIKNKTLIYDGEFIGGVSYRVAIAIDTDGKIEELECGFKLTDASYVKAVCNVGVSVCGEEKEKEADISQICLTDYNAMLKMHKDNFQSVMGRVDFEIKSEDTSPLYLEDKMELFRNGKEDVEIYNLVFDFGRYLLATSSMWCKLPTNLQGKWNAYTLPPWNSDYHYDINLQMSYWLAEPLNLPECAQVLVDYIVDKLEEGKKSAQNLYGCRGVYLPLADDPWGKCTPESCYFGVWIGAAPWLAQHIWWRYEYSGDKAFLKNTAYDFFKAVAEFYEDYLVKDENGIYQIYPSQSPENRFTASGELLPVSICKSSAMDIELAYDALGYAIKTAEILEIDKDKIALWNHMRDNLPKVKIARDGRIVEWDSEDKIEAEPGHRHLSPLYGLYPSELFTKEKSPEHFDAAVKSLKVRIDSDGLKCPFQYIWAECMFARIGDVKKYQSIIGGILKSYFTDNLLSVSSHGYTHIKEPLIFQIESNYGMTSAILEAVAGYHDNTLFLLNSLPDTWQSGHLYGYKMPGGHSIDFEWENGRISKASVTMGFSGKLKLSFSGKMIELSGSEGEEKVIM